MAMTGRHKEATKERIKTSQIINRLQKHIDGDVELTSSQVAAARILLDKSLPNVATIQHTGDSKLPIHHEIRVTIVDPRN